MALIFNSYFILLYFWRSIFDFQKMAVRVTYYIIFFLSYYSLSLFIFVFHYLNLLKYSRDGVHFIIFSLFPSFSIISFHIYKFICSEGSADFWLNFIVSLSNLLIINLNRIYIYKFLYFYNFFFNFYIKFHFNEKNLNFLGSNFLIISNSNLDLKKKTFKYLNYFYLNIFYFVFSNHYLNI